MQFIPLITAGIAAAGVATQATLGGISAAQGEKAMKQTASQNQALLARSQLTSQRASLAGSGASLMNYSSLTDLNPSSSGKRTLLGG